MEKIENARESRFAENSGFFPVLVKAGGGLIVFYRAGAGHYGKTGRVDAAWSADGLNWEPPVAVAAGDTDYRNPCIGVLKDGSVLAAVWILDAYHGENETFDPDRVSVRTVFFHSADPRAGKWSRSEPARSIISSPYGRMIYFRDRLLMPAYEFEHSHLFASSSEGAGWDEKITIARGYYEPAVVEAGGGLIAALRGSGRSVDSTGTFLSRSADGINWSAPAAATPDNTHPADLTPLSNGCVLLTFAERNPARQRIMAMISGDAGASWRGPVQISPEFSNCDFGYPSTVETEPGRIATAYYFRPGFDRMLPISAEERYSPAGATGACIAYPLDELDHKAIKSGIAITLPG